MREKIAGLETKDYGALLLRLSQGGRSARELALELKCSLSMVHKMMEGERSITLEDWLDAVLSGSREGVKRLAQDLGFVCVRRNGSLAQVLRELAAELEEGPGPAGEARHPHNPLR